MVRSYPPVPESGEETEDIESEDIVEEETEAEVPEDDEETEEDDFYMSAGTAPSTS